MSRVFAKPVGVGIRLLVSDRPATQRSGGAA